MNWGLALAIIVLAGVLGLLLALILLELPWRRKDNDE